ncbi:HetP family heterocyst commitment protein [Phormidesmis sp. 146-35]
MNHSILHSQNSDRRTDKVMEPEQFTQVIEAILAGKYSWACVLILRFAGYNPLHYIPYRTYNRLVKDNAQCRKRDRVHAEEINQNESGDRVGQIQDLAYLEAMSEQQKTIHGGCFKNWVTNSIPSIKLVKDLNICLK